jgi:hypothetical protein
MRRRDFMAAVGGALVAMPLAARAQQAPKITRVGMLIPSALDAPVTHENLGVIRQALAELGYRARTSPSSSAMEMARPSGSRRWPPSSSI